MVVYVCIDVSGHMRVGKCDILFGKFARVERHVAIVEFRAILSHV